MTNKQDGRAALLTGSFALMGALKLLGLERPLFQRWGYGRRDMRLVGAAEAAGAALVANPETRVLGAAGLAAVSAIMLGVETRNGDALLALPRGALLLVALATALRVGDDEIA